MDSDVDFTLVSTLHAEGRHIQAEWERLKGNKAREDAMEDELASHRLSFFLGAVAVWQALQEADDDEAVVEEIQDELETFLAATEAEGRISLSDREPLQ